MKVLVLTGPESTGKSWLAARLHQQFGGLLVGEYVRDFIDREQRDTCLADIPAIARGQLALEDAARSRAPHLLILDTHLLSNILWSRTLFGSSPAWLEDELLQRQYHQHLLLSPEGIPWHDDGQRCQPGLAERQGFYEECRSWLTNRNQHFVEIGGTWAERERRANAHTRALLGN
ncbi:MAG: AAA family ATPase [Pseudomonas stutzeri]|uniref:AAA family ATPase n=1 Tax=Stutzerimonas stutzeri TaxID=316 RepID=UPI0021095AF2|nr:AAA family ATPase [Stutzerimonas stutzeri]MBF6624561.1 AAA family ATPase [Stutzerimonas stutzeri]MCQ4242254.1 AAA family ATPase [Stutzerimonas stutzeri]